MKGKCLCGAVSFAVEIASPQVEACHCTMCRSWTSGPFLTVPYDGKVAFSGAEVIGTYQASSWGERAFCKTCGSTLYWKLQGSDHFAFSAGTLDDQAALTFTRQIFIDEKPPYYDFANTTTRLTGEQVAAEFAAKMKS